MEEGQLIAQLQLQPRVLALFKPPPPLEHLPPFALSKRRRNSKAAGMVPRVPMSGIAEFVKEFEKKEEEERAARKNGGGGGDDEEKEEGEKERRLLRHPVLALQARLPPRKTSSGMLLPPLERRSARLEAARLRNEEKKRVGIKAYDPKEDPNAAGTDPYRTLFVARLPFEIDEATLRREFEEFGPVSRVSIVVPRAPATAAAAARGGEGDGDGGDGGKAAAAAAATAGASAAAKNKDNEKEKKPPPASRGYAFIEFERAEDMKAAYKRADGRRISSTSASTSKDPATSHSRRILVDVERGRTVEGWLPRRLGGGKGGGSEARRAPREPVNERKRKWLGLVQLPRAFYTQRKLAAMAPRPSAAAPPLSSSSRYGGGGGGGDRDRDRGGGGASAPLPWERGGGSGGGGALPPPPMPPLPSSRTGGGGGGDDYGYDDRRDRGSRREGGRRSRSRSPRDRDRDRGGSRRDRDRDRGERDRRGGRTRSRSRSRERGGGGSSRGRGYSPPPPRASFPPPPPPPLPAARRDGRGSEDEEEGELK